MRGTTTVIAVAGVIAIAAVAICSAEDRVQAPAVPAGAPRPAPRLPKVKSPRPLFLKVAFGENGDNGALMLLDQSFGEGTAYDIGYVDENCDGDLSNEKPVKFEMETCGPDHQANLDITGEMNFSMPDPAQPGKVLKCRFRINHYMTNWVGDHAGIWWPQSIKCVALLVTDGSGSSMNFSQHYPKIEFQLSAAEAAAKPVLFSSKLSVKASAQENGGEMWVSLHMTDVYGNKLVALKDEASTPVKGAFITVLDKDGHALAQDLGFKGQYAVRMPGSIDQVGKATVTIDMGAFGKHCQDVVITKERHFER